MFFDILYNITIYPIEFIIEILFYLFNNVFRSSYGVSLFLLSLSINFLSLPLYNIAESWQAKERAVQDKMKPMIDNIKAVYKGDQRYLLIRACQRINGYKTIYAFRGTLGLLIQIPFFMAAYNFVHSLTGLNGQSFLFIEDLSKPDALIRIGNISINLFPFLMTLFSLLAGFVYSKKLKFKESLPLYIVSFIFLVLLYNSPSGLLFYWTVNCLFSLIKNIIIEYKLYNIFIRNRFKLLKAYNIFFIIITVIFILLLSLSRIERKGYLSDFEFINYRDGYFYEARVRYYSKIFITSDIFSFVGNENKFDDNIVSIKYKGDSSIVAAFTLKDKVDNIKDDIVIYYRLSPRSYTINIYLFLIFITIIVNLYNIYIIIFNKVFLKEAFEKNRYKLMLISCLVITILSGAFIPSSLIGASPQEFKAPFYLIFNDLSMSIGLFLIYPIFIYSIFSEKIKNYITLLFIFIVSIILINVFIMKGNYLNINSDFIFDNTDLLKASFKEIVISIMLFLLMILILILFFKKNKINIIMNVYLVIIITLFSISIFNIVNIVKEHNKLVNAAVDNNNIKIFNLSKMGKNIFVFILDRSVNSYWIDAMERFPEYKEKLDGFVLYPNTVSFCNKTIGIAALYGGYDYLPYELSTNGSYNIKDKHNESLLMLPLSLEKYGYKSVILEPSYANLQWVPDLSIFEGYTNINAYNNDKVLNYSLHNYLGDTDINVEEYNLMSQKNKIIRFSIFRMIPINLRYSLYMNGKWLSFNEVTVNTSVYSYSILANIKNIINFHERGNYYNILHNMVPHEPFFFASDFLPYGSSIEVDSKDLEIYKNEYSVRSFYANASCLNVLIDFIKFLKDNDVYDNTKIIVISDHGSFNVDRGTGDYLSTSDFFNAFNSLLMYKDFNTKGSIKIDTNFMTIADMPYIATKHISNIKNVFNGNIITNDYKINGVNLISANGGFDYKNRYAFDIYYFIKDNIFDTNSWKKYIMDWNTKESKELEDIELKYE